MNTRKSTDPIYHRNEWSWGWSSIIVIDDGNGLIKVSVEKCKPKLAYISQLNVSPSKRNKGLGKRLLHLAEEEAKRLKTNKVEIDAIPGAFTVEWYKREGYRIINENEDYITLKKLL